VRKVMQQWRDGEARRAAVPPFVRKRVLPSLKQIFAGADVRQMPLMRCARQPVILQSRRLPAMIATLTPAVHIRPPPI